jgi:hypothetical protein
MGKRIKDQDFLTDYKDYISHQYTWSRRGPIDNFILHIWKTRKPYSRKMGLFYFLYGFFILVLSGLSYIGRNTEYTFIFSLFIATIGIIMVIWGIIKIIRG